MSEHFQVKEFRCHDGTPYPTEWVDTRLAQVMSTLEVIRTKCNCPIEVISGYRSPAHNATLIAEDESKGSHQVASGSMHVEGYAADIRPADKSLTPAIILNMVLTAYAANELPYLGGCAAYPVSNWVHIDCRPRVPPDHLARWIGV